MAAASAPPPDLLALDEHVGQRPVTFRLELVDRLGVRRGRLTPLRSSTPSLSHDTTATISRRVTGLTLGAGDSALIRPLTDRIDIAMVLGATPPLMYPLGRYLIADAVSVHTTGGTTTALTLYDPMFIVDQQLEAGFDAGGALVDTAVRRLLDGLPIGELVLDATEQNSTNSWSAGTSRAAALLDLATVGGYVKPWFNHTGQLRMPRASEPAAQAPTIDLDHPRRVLRGSITRSPQMLSAPNRFVVVSNDPTSDAAPVIGTYDVPSSAPHSINQRGFIIPTVVEAQLPSQRHATVYARTLGIQQAVYEVVELSTPPDPRHDGYDVVRFDGQLWLETGWEMPLTAGGEMRHTLRRAYPSDGDL
ncbi:hypothetical protein [Couchioplanes caeruleus]|uniref:Uncharacterized protein n=2 Tax=Couchioplanes caeruleus TaxID=56438 RepID=A0A1K0FRR3_9ACTN|nr:hypothetical protein [Couchioplanes caeruleus]OJF15384.1 hypothetical protein BG844_04595 [Couchioplanes caeruleus subsp. caeruleus]ROP33423.1 hypothetical protein EDD30_6403 [Couchioplanes caeruleus]